MNSRRTELIEDDLCSRDMDQIPFLCTAQEHRARRRSEHLVYRADNGPTTLTPAQHVSPYSSTTFVRSAQWNMGLTFSR